MINIKRIFFILLIVLLVGVVSVATAYHCSTSFSPPSTQTTRRHGLQKRLLMHSSEDIKISDNENIENKEEEMQREIAHDDSSLVYQRPEVAEAFVNIRGTIPMAKEQMDTIIRIIRYFQPKEDDGPKIWLDLGCGDGPIAERLLNEFPSSHGTLIDHSQPMLDLAQKKLSEFDNVDFRLGDFSKEDFIENCENNFDVIVSGYAIHHVSHSRKRTLYKQIFHMLKPGGVFLNMEHVATPTAHIEAIFETAFCDSMYEAFKNSGVPKSRKEIEAAVRYDLSVDKDANILAPVEEQCQWLRDIGFTQVDCYFKFFILSLFGGVKPNKII